MYTLFSPEVMLPSQYGETQALSYVVPEVRLYIAILESAVEDIRKGAIRSGVRPMKLSVRAREWVSSRDASYPTTFERICHLLKLNASAVRRVLLAHDSRVLIGPLPTDTIRLGGWRDQPRVGYELLPAMEADAYSISVCTPEGKYVMAPGGFRKADVLHMGAAFYQEQLEAHSTASPPGSRLSET